MKIVRTIARILLGLMFTIFGANGFAHFIPSPPPLTGLAGQYTAVLFQSHYLVAVALLELIAGVLLLVNRYVPIALVLLGPVLVNILLFHALMQPKGLPPGIVATALYLVVLYGVKSSFSGLFVMKTDS